MDKIDSKPNGLYIEIIDDYVEERDVNTYTKDGEVKTDARGNPVTKKAFAQEAWLHIPGVPHALGFDVSPPGADRPYQKGYYEFFSRSFAVERRRLSFAFGLPIRPYVDRSKG